MHLRTPGLLLTIAVALSAAQAYAADTKVTPPPKVSIAFNRLYDYPELVEQLKALVAAHPDLLTMKSIGKSIEGRDMWCVTINNSKTGSDRSKPAMYVDGNIHGNEVQAAETCLYLIWYLTENYGRVETITKLVDERVFYVIPTVNPDGRAWWFTGPNTTNSSRSGKSPIDDDRDGVADEDGYEDLNGDGQITQMRRKIKGGRFKLSPTDPRIMIAVTKPEEEGDYELLGSEGIDNDGDGQINEDGPGGYDMNRNWPADWQPEHVQFGAGDYPLCWPETRCIADFIRDHTNIAGVQAFHNAAGMILRGPGHPSRQADYPAGDDRIHDEIGKVGEKMLPFYRNFVTYKDLYGVHGGFIGWTYEHLGIFSFTNELWNNEQLLGRSATTGTTLERAIGGGEQDDQLFASDRLLFGSNYRPWKPFKHPFYGDIEIGGFVKETQRVPPMFMLEDLCHRNAAFVMYHADQMPKLIWDDVTVAKLNPGLFTVTASVKNIRSIPSVAQQAANRRIGLPDTITIHGDNLKVLAGGPLANRDTGEIDAAEFEPATLRLNSGVGGGSTVRVRWIIQGKGPAHVRYHSQKGGSLEKAVLNLED